MKIKNLLQTIVLSIIVLTFGCKKDKYEEIKSLCPIVVSTNPVNGATGVPLNQIVTATFNTKINPATINQQSFTLKSTTNVSGVLTYNEANNTLSFDPTDSLKPNTTYTGVITTAVTDFTGNSLQENYIWTFSTGVLIAPLVVITDPANNDSGVALNKAISATFNMPMDPSTINATSFMVKNGTVPVLGAISFSGNTAIFTPTNLLIRNTVYTCTLTTAIKNTLGTSLAADYVWTFKTLKDTAPKVISTSPTSNETNVVLNKTVTADFDMLMDPASINNSTFKIFQGTTAIAGTVSYTGTRASFIPSVPFLPGLVYTATITTGAKNTYGTGLVADYVWTFTTIVPTPPTVISTIPANNAIDVPLDQVISATFSMPMDPLTLNSTTFTVKQAGNLVSGSIGYSGSTVAFVPTVDLLPGLLYTVTITNGAKSAGGVAMVSDYVWTFTTEMPIAPTVISTNPADQATDVALNKIISATFSVAMDPSTINTSTFTLKIGSTPVSGTVNYSGTTATFTPTANLLSDNTYTATITNSVKNLAGTFMVSNYVWTFDTKAHLGPNGPDLKSAADFGILAGVGISNNAGFSKINDMDVGISPGVRSSVTGFPPAIVVNGAIYCSDDLIPAGVAAMLIQAKQDLTDVYLEAEGATSPAPVTVSGDQGGLTLAPGIYKTTSTLKIESGDLTLDAQGDANAVWIFQIASGFTTIGGAGGSVILTGGAKASNVFWQVGSSATIGDNTTFKGNVLALTSITMNSNAVADGRMLARNGSVVMTSTNIINKP